MSSSDVEEDNNTDELQESDVSYYPQVSNTEAKKSLVGAKPTLSLPPYSPYIEEAVSLPKELDPDPKRAAAATTTTITGNVTDPYITLEPYTSLVQHAINPAPQTIQEHPEPPTEDDLKPDTPVTVSEITTEYKGRRAESITYEITSALRLEGNSQFAFPVNKYEDGELVHFTVSVNDNNIQVVCILYDSKNRATTICNHSAKDLVVLGRGMTLSEAETKDNNGVSTDRSGVTHHVVPYVARYKDTFSYGFHDPADYATVEGTANDKVYVIDYAPSLPRAYKRIYFNIVNNSNERRLINQVSMNRYAYVDEYDYVIKDNPAAEQPKAKITF